MRTILRGPVEPPPGLAGVTCILIRDTDFGPVATGSVDEDARAQLDIEVFCKRDPNAKHCRESD